jgi:hypothetical protein
MAEESKSNEAFVPEKPFNLVYDLRVGPDPSHWDILLALPTNVRPGLKSLSSRTNTTAYFAPPSVTKTTRCTPWPLLPILLNAIKDGGLCWLKSLSLASF